MLSNISLFWTSVQTGIITCEFAFTCHNLIYIINVYNIIVSRGNHIVYFESNFWNFQETNGNVLTIILSFLPSSNKHMRIILFVSNKCEMWHVKSKINEHWDCQRRSQNLNQHATGLMFHFRCFTTLLYGYRREHILDLHLLTHSLDSLQNNF